MTWLYLIGAIALLFSPLALPLPAPAGIRPVLEALAEQTDVPNLVSGVILHTRLFDTVAEVVVFTLASVGVRHLLSQGPARGRIHALEDPATVVLCQFGATLSALIAVELALRGHLSPGGGFAAGVAGGSAIGLLLISGSAERTQTLYVRYRADLWEKAAVMAFVTVAFLALEGVVLPSGRFGMVMSGGWIPLLNALVAIKVTLGSWAMVQMFVRYCGLL